MEAMRMTSTQWKNLNSWKIRLWPTWRESSRTSGLGGTRNTNSKVDLISVDPVDRGSEETGEDHLQGRSTDLVRNLVW